MGKNGGKPYICIVMIHVDEPVYTVPATEPGSVRSRVYALLGECGMPVCRVECEPAITMEQCRAVEARLGVEVVKTVVLTNRKCTKFYLYVMPGEEPFVTRDFCGKLGVPRVSFASEELMLSLLGTPHGAATPLSVVADTEGAVQVVIDRRVTELDEIGCTDTVATCFVRVSVAALMEKYLPATGHAVTVI